jgi:transcriptional regulator with XRE-family HTH domain
MNTVGKKVLEYISNHGWSVPTTAKRSGLPIPTVKNIIYGSSLTHKKQTLEKLANAFGCKVEDLNDYSENTATPRVKKDNHDFEVLDECFDAIKSFISRRKLSYSNKQLMKVVDNLSSFVIKKRVTDPSYKIRDDIIECILDNLTS